MTELERHNYLAPLEKDSNNVENFVQRQVGFCSQWCLDNLCESVHASNHSLSNYLVPNYITIVSDFK